VIKYELTKKIQVNENDASNQIEQTILLNEEEFNLISTLSGRKLHKIRYFLEYEKRTAEIDVFQGELRGLVLVDFEFDDELELNNFKMPDFCLADVTQEVFIAGGKLCGKTYSDIEKKLKEFSYLPLYL
jgi:CYTH domain-containing protein